MRRIAFAVPGDIMTLTGGYAYDRRIILELKRLGWQVDAMTLGEGYPWPSETTRAAAYRRLSVISADTTIVIDGLALGALPDIGARVRPPHPIVALVHHPLALESGLSVVHAAVLRESERAALSAAVRVVTTSETTARCLIAGYAVPADRIVVAAPGVDSCPIARAGADEIVSLLSVGALAPRKGYDTLIAALAKLADLPWRLAIAGDRNRDPRTSRELEASIVECGLSNRISLLGAVTSLQLEELFLSADLFVLASRFEGYGMAFAEAIAHGLPVIGTTAGAIPDTAPVGAGVFVPSEDVDALANALRLLIENQAERGKLAAGAREAIPYLPRWSDSARKFARALETI
ncbi:MAG TPA: glycosyltransferase family 4 protein [Roseiarcus sp.]|nr:glycosyltransferase family 4 protein [Roseiarcus sp.]